MPLAPTAPPPRLPFPYRPEPGVVAAALNALQGLDWSEVVAAATPWVRAVRQHPAPFWALESLLREYPISSAEGLALMRLAEALLRVPDVPTAIALTADQLGRADFDAEGSEGTDEAAPHRLLASLSASAIALSKRLLPDDGRSAHSGLLQRLGSRTVVAATVRAIQLLGRQFVLGTTMTEALREAAAQRRSLGPGGPALRFSYDMLGEGARTDADARRYLAAYANAIDTIASGLAARAEARGPENADGISIKLSALFPRYEDAQRDRVMAELLPRVWTLVQAAARADINLTIDAEESDRLELSLELIDALASRVAAEQSPWRGFGLAVQTYQTRALETVDAAVEIARRHGLRLMVRLVKGAYWDAEIKRAQELGLPGYPVFTHKQHTDIAYLACARALLAHAGPGGAVYPQFATHNAGSIAAILSMARGRHCAFEFQRLHGMGESLYREVLRHGRGAAGDTTTPASPAPAGVIEAAESPVPLRVYAPVGEHRDLLAYLVRRLLENGANSSFVHQLSDPQVDTGLLLRSPLAPLAEPGQPMPVSLYVERANSRGLDLSVAAMRSPIDEALANLQLDAAPEADEATVDRTMLRLNDAARDWSRRDVAARAAVLDRAADALESRLPGFCALLIAEGRKTAGDAVAEVREAVDFCRYYAAQARTRLAPQTLPGPTGESNELRLHGRGVFVCISPWNFPLAIFAGQVVAALVAGNAVAAKPAEQTPVVAQRFVALLHEAGVPRDALALLHGPGETVGAALVAHRLAAGVCFTGSTAVARHIQRSLAAKDGPIVPLIAETGGLNAMIVDSSALPEQVVDAVVQSAFRSAGQRCSALRLLVLHEGIAEGVLKMLAGAMAELRVGDPALLATDVGPVIDAEAHAQLLRHVERLEREARLVARSPLPADAPPQAMAPVAFEIERIGDLREEIFGPVLHVVLWSGNVDDVVRQINDLGYGLTLGIQTRIDSRAQRIAALARVGNVYVNRNMIGAVVGVQPFGGEGLSGSGPKAGGPHYLQRFCAEQTLTINTAAAGGNAALLAGRSEGSGSSR